MNFCALYNSAIVLLAGDVKLDNLEVKETALDDLDLPVKLKFGYLSSLVLKVYALFMSASKFSCLCLITAQVLGDLY